MPVAFDNEMEMALLSYLIRHGDIIYEVMGRLHPQMFTGEQHEIIYRAMEALANTGTDINYLFLNRYLSEKKQLDKVGGSEYIDLLVQFSLPTEDYRKYVEAIESSYKTRELVRMGSMLHKKAYEYPPDELIQQLTLKLDSLIQRSGSDVLHISERLKASMEAIAKKMENPGVQGRTTGFSRIDYRTNAYNPGDIWYIGARPSMGKSAWLMKSFLESAKQGTPALIFNKEMHPQGVDERLLSMDTGVPLHKITRGELNEEEFNKLRQTEDNLSALPLYFDDNWLVDDRSVVASVRKHKKLSGIELIGIDYIQLMVERSESMVHDLGRFSRRLKLLAGELDLTVVVLSQLNREVDKRDDKRPLMADLRQSGNMEEDADYMVALYREEMYVRNSPKQGQIEFIIRKARNGPTGTINLGFQADTVSVYDPDDVQMNWSNGRRKEEREQVGA